MKCFTVVIRDANSWLRTPAGDISTIKAECGHKHKTIAAAVACLRKLDGTTARIGAGVEVWAENQHIDGRPVGMARGFEPAESLDELRAEQDELDAAVMSLVYGR